MRLFSNFFLGRYGCRIILFADRASRSEKRNTFELVIQRSRINYKARSFGRKGLIVSVFRREGQPSFLPHLHFLFPFFISQLEARRFAGAPLEFLPHATQNSCVFCPLAGVGSFPKDGFLFFLSSFLRFATPAFFCRQHFLVSFSLSYFNGRAGSPALFRAPRDAGRNPIDVFRLLRGPTRGPSRQMVPVKRCCLAPARGPTPEIDAQDNPREKKREADAGSSPPTRISRARPLITASSTEIT